MLKYNLDIIKKPATKRNLAILVVAIAALAYSARLALFYKDAISLLEATTKYTEMCINDDAICGGLRATNRNLEEQLSKLPQPLKNSIMRSEEYQRLQSDLWPKAQQNLATADKEHAELNQRIVELEQFGKALDQAKSLAAEQNAELERAYHKLGAPKLLYSCNGHLRLIASKGISNYNSIYIEAKNDCGEDSTFEVISSEK